MRLPLQRIPAGRGDPPLERIAIRVIIHTSSVIVPQRESAAHLEQVRSILLPNCENAEGLVSVCVSERETVAYAEVLTISTWQSEDALRRFIQDNGRAAAKDRGGYFT